MHEFRVGVRMMPIERVENLEDRGWRLHGEITNNKEQITNRETFVICYLVFVLCYFSEPDLFPAGPAAVAHVTRRRSACSPAARRSASVRTAPAAPAGRESARARCARLPRRGFPSPRAASLRKR